MVMQMDQTQALMQSLEQAPNLLHTLHKSTYANSPTNLFVGEFVNHQVWSLLKFQAHEVKRPKQLQYFLLQL